MSASKTMALSEVSAGITYEIGELVKTNAALRDQNVRLSVENDQLRKGLRPPRTSPMGMRIEDKAVALITEHGLFGLCESDGCLCCNFSIHNVHVSVSCRKSEKCVRVWSDSMDYDAAMLEKVIRAVLADLARYDSTYLCNAYRLRFCEYAFDHYRAQGQDGQWSVSHRCCYCNGPRAVATDYLCEACKAKPDAVQRYPWTGDGFMAAG